MLARPIFYSFTALCVCAMCALGAMANVYQPRVMSTLALLQQVKMADNAAPAWASRHTTVLGVIQGKTP